MQARASGVTIDESHAYINDDAAFSISLLGNCATVWFEFPQKVRFKKNMVARELLYTSSVVEKRAKSRTLLKNFALLDLSRALSRDSSLSGTRSKNNVRCSMKRFFLCIFVSLLLCFSSCGPELSNIESLITRQPRVIAIDPADGLIVPEKTSVKITFSMPVDPTSVGPNSYAVVKIDGKAPEIDDLETDVSKGETPVFPGNYQISDNWREATFVPDEPFEGGATYGVIITTDVKTALGFPLNQKPGEEPTPFWSIFKIREAGDADSDGYGDSADGEGGEGGDEGGDEGGGGESQAPQRPAKLIINEIIYDALSDELDGNLFVELVGDAESDIGGYKIVFVNGAGGAATETIDIPDNSIIADDGIFLIADSRTGAPTQTNIPGADFLDNFDPQNGPDCVQLLDDHGALLDAVGYGSPLPQNAQNGLACFEGAAGPDAPAGKSVSRTNNIDTDNNAADFKILDSPTPGVL